ncbi:MAG TPA: GNAT family protein [Gemmatimonadaceae bacterium]|nr:GNAT family protein [Gemmatimonadaceae bacterium]
MTIPDHFYYIDDDIYFRGLRESDLNGRWPEWFNDPVVTKYQAKGYRPNTREQQRAYYDRLVTSTTDVVLAIIERSSEKHIGNVGLHQIDPLHRTAVLGIVIGEPSAWRRRIGARSWRAITSYGFEVLGLHKICATVIDGNEASLKCALAAGYTVEGRQLQQIYKNGAHRDLIHVGLLKEKWTA